MTTNVRYLHQRPGQWTDAHDPVMVELVDIYGIPPADGLTTSGSLTVAPTATFESAEEAAREVLRAWYNKED